MLPTNIAEIINWSTELSADFIKQLNEVAVVKTNMSIDELEGSQMAHQGISYIITGTVVICLQTPNLKTVNNIVMGQGDWFGNYNAEDTNYMPFIITEVEKATFVYFENRKLKKIAERDLEAYKWFHSLFFTARDKWLQSQLIMSENILIRVTYLLIELCVHQKYIQGEKPKITISQQHISQITGITRQRVNETIKQLETMGLLYLARGCIYLSNIKALCKKLDGVDLSIRDPRKLVK